MFEVKELTPKINIVDYNSVTVMKLY